MRPLTLLADLSTIGFASVELPPNVFDEAMGVAKQFYQLPLAERFAIGAFSTRGVLGYYPSESEVKDLESRQGGVGVPLFTGGRARGYASFDFIANPKVEGSSELVARNLWPRSEPQFRERTCAVYAALSAVALGLTEELVEALRPSVDVPAWVFGDDCCSLMRFLRYSDPARPPSKPHTDYEFITLTLADAPGLEVLGSNGEWQPVPCVPGRVVVLPGDMIELASGGRILSSVHRVAAVGRPRTSVVFFQGLPLGQKLETAFGDYSPGTFGHHLFAMLVRGAAHLADSIGEWEDRLGVKIPATNPFRRRKE